MKLPKRIALPASLLTACAVGGLLNPPSAEAQSLGSVFVINMENHNFTQPSGQTSPQALFNNPAAPYMTSLITPGNPNAAQSSWASNYHNVGTGIHPSLPNYLWEEGGSNFGALNDNQPYTSTGGNGTGGTNLGAKNLSAALQNNGVSWKSYQEDIDTDATGAVLSQNQWTVPLTNRSGAYSGAAAVPNAYNGSKQYDFATKHDGSLYFTATNGGFDKTTANPMVSHYAPLQQLTNDLNANAVSRYNVITPNQFNDAHTSLSGGFTYKGVHYTGDAANIAQGDNFLSILIPKIMASNAYKNNGAIVIWWDETEGGDSAAYTLSETILSPLAKGNAYNSTLNYTHSSDLKTMQEIFGVTGDGFLGDAANPNTKDLADFFQAGVIPTAVPEPSQTAALAMGALMVSGVIFRARKRK